METKTVKIELIDTSSMTKPREKKLAYYRDYSRAYGSGQLQKVNPIVINGNYELVDGYCTYLLMKEKSNQNEDLSVFLTDNDTIKVVTGIILKSSGKNCTKEYSWKYRLKKPIVPGAIVAAAVGEKRTAWVEITDITVQETKYSTITKSILKIIE